jgi:hypothetical protein
VNNAKMGKLEDSKLEKEFALAVMNVTGSGGYAYPNGEHWWLHGFTGSVLLNSKTRKYEFFE